MHLYIKKSFTVFTKQCILENFITLIRNNLIFCENNVDKFQLEMKVLINLWKCYNKLKTKRIITSKLKTKQKYHYND